MGGFSPEPQFFEELEEAEDTLFKHGFDSESDAVEQAIVLLRRVQKAAPDVWADVWSLDWPQKLDGKT